MHNLTSAWVILCALFSLVACHAEGKLPTAIVKAEFVNEKPQTPDCHASTIVETKDKTLLVAWFGGSAEGKPDVAIWLAREENQNWTTVKVIDGLYTDGKRYPAWNPVLFQPRNGPLMLFYKLGASPSQWWGMLKTSTDDGKTWSVGTRLPDSFMGPIKNKPVQLPNNDILCPTSIEKGNDWLVYFERTSDLGKTWTKTPTVNETTIHAIQPSILSISNGNLMAIGRTRDGYLFQTKSSDQGFTWGPMTLTALPNPNSGTDAVSLKDGSVMLVYNHSPGPKPGKWGGPRTPLNISTSPDGQTWNAALVLESSAGEYSYPAMIQTQDGLVHITYSWNRKKIKHVVLDPAKLSPQPIVEGKWPLPH